MHSRAWVTSIDTEVEGDRAFHGPKLGRSTRCFDMVPGLVLPLVGSGFGGLLAYREWRAKAKTRSLPGLAVEAVARGAVFGALLGFGVAVLGTVIST